MGKQERKWRDLIVCLKGFFDFVLCVCVCVLLFSVERWDGFIIRGERVLI
ncbi:hypothetical protein Scep_021692 [Stephania cephalantha]|uniref:Transmembrane protein n=1 Tax=Stephania cephalantha TaxID=152367 RepID=A0AAP0HX24_9MAGN